ncbi:hypothetical protein HZA97_10125 [Candidatus Woesearchaeota archaeon]|nr:hypothetical protein [Candidatus Woesearchaeota archaeon]
MNADVESIQELCRTYKPLWEKTLIERHFQGQNPLRSKGVCGLATHILGNQLSKHYLIMDQVSRGEKITGDNSGIIIWGLDYPGFFNQHTFLVISDIIVDGAFHQYMDAFNLAHEEPNDILVVPYSRLDEKVEEMVSKSRGELPQGVRDLEHLKRGLRSIWDYKIPHSYVREFHGKRGSRNES